MNSAATWRIDPTKILVREEIALVIADLKRPAKRRSVNTRQNLIIFRLANCCGLRVSEIAGLRLANVKLAMHRPYIDLPKAIAKGSKARRIPLWWDGGTLADLTAWKAEREQQGAKAGDWFVCSQADGSFGAQLHRQNLRARFKTACKVLGSERVGTLTIHHGRHSFVSHALAGGRTLADVRDAAGHSNVSTTSIYTHVAADDGGEVGDLFAFEP